MRHTSKIMRFRTDEFAREWEIKRYSRREEVNRKHQEESHDTKTHTSVQSDRVYNYTNTSTPLQHVSSFTTELKRVTETLLALVYPPTPYRRDPAHPPTPVHRHNKPQDSKSQHRKSQDRKPQNHRHSPTKHTRHHTLWAPRPHHRRHRPLSRPHLPPLLSRVRARLRLVQLCPHTPPSRRRRTSNRQHRLSPPACPRQNIQVSPQPHQRVL